ncbi:four helix bundle protein [Candidatus Kuenenbacteria bacterium]|nr:four helix bundle protein [Candidatus Kuenenbacteria bacterium]
MEQKDVSSKNQLYDRCLKFAQDVRALVRQLAKTIANIEDGKQLVRSSGSVGANYIEGWEAISSKDELHRLKICRKAAKESRHWLSLLYIPDTEKVLLASRKDLVQEALELTKILGSIIHKKEGTNVIKES